ncbi:MAG: hypothetical protein ACK5MP_05320 [Nostocoides sp.]
MISRRTAVTGPLSALTVAALAGCGLGDRVAGVRPVPTEAETTAPLDTTAAALISSRVLSDANIAAATGGAAGSKARKAVMTGHALAMAEAAVSTNTAPALPDPSVRPPVAQVLAVSRSHNWPRYIVATTLDTTTSTRSLHVLVSAAATGQYKVSESMPMVSGTSVPGLGPVEQGVEVVPNASGLPASPAAALAAYAKALAYPKPVKTTLVSLTDAASTALAANATRQQSQLGALAKLRQSHVPNKALPIAFRTADGGAVAFGMMTRSDVVTLTSKAKEVVLPADLAKLLGKSKVSTSVTVTTLEPVCLVIPSKGSASVIGMSEQITSVKGS